MPNPRLQLHPDLVERFITAQRQLLLKKYDNEIRIRNIPLDQLDSTLRFVERELDYRYKSTMQALESNTPQNDGRSIDLTKTMPEIIIEMSGRDVKTLQGLIEASVVQELGIGKAVETGASLKSGDLRNKLANTIRDSNIRVRSKVKASADTKLWLLALLAAQIAHVAIEKDAIHDMGIINSARGVKEKGRRRTPRPRPDSIWNFWRS